MCAVFIFDEIFFLSIFMKTNGCEKGGGVGQPQTGAYFNSKLKISVNTWDDKDAIKGTLSMVSYLSKIQNRSLPPIRPF